MKKASVVRGAVFLVLASTAVAALFHLPVKDSLKAVLEWTRGLGPWAPVVIAFLYIPSCLLFLPGSVLTIGAGFVCGVLAGTAAVSVGSTLGAAAAFLAGRTLARGWVEKRVASSERFRAVERAVEREGWKIVLLTRLSPVFPFNLLNYAYGLTPVRFGHYVAASWVGMLPGTVLYVYLGSALQNLADLAAGRVEGGPAGKVLFGAGLLATAVVAVFVTRLARKALPEHVPADGLR